jgi:hypothetical protein
VGAFEIISIAGATSAEEWFGTRFSSDMAKASATEDNISRASVVLCESGWRKGKRTASAILFEVLL